MKKNIVNIFTLFIAIEHFGFLILEMFLWVRPIGHRVFKMTPVFAEQTAVLAANQGLYNGFLAAGLIWALTQAEPFRRSLQIFFFSCVAVAGLYGFYSISSTILYVQAIPAIVALGLILGLSDK